MASSRYEVKTLDRVKRRLQQQRGQGGWLEERGRGQGGWLEEERGRARAGSIDTLYTGTKVRDIPEFSLRVVTRPSPGEGGRGGKGRGEGERGEGE